jgi:hypothetical protein
MLASEILTDLSHVALDLVTLCGPSTVVVRLAAVVGRICSVGADYLPDHSMLPEEVWFQAFMLCVASTGLLQAMLPNLVSLVAPKPTLRDGKAFHHWGQPAGLSWEAFKALTTVRGVEWTVMEPGQSMETQPNTIYWLYRGQINVDRRGRNCTVYHKSGNRLPHIHGASAVDLTSLQGTPQNATQLTATGGATLLTLRLDRLPALLRNDASLREVVQRLVWQGLQDQLAEAYDMPPKQGEAA